MKFKLAKDLHWLSQQADNPESFLSSLVRIRVITENNPALLGFIFGDHASTCEHESATLDFSNFCTGEKAHHGSLRSWWSCEKAENSMRRIRFLAPC